MSTLTDFYSTGPGATGGYIGDYPNDYTLQNPGADTNNFFSGANPYSPESAAASSATAPLAAQAAGTAGNSGALAGAGIGAGLGVLNAVYQNAQRNKMVHAAATQTKFSPWTHLGAGQTPAPANPIGSLAGLTAAGAMQGQALGGGSIAPLALSQQPGSMYQRPNPWTLGVGNGG